MVLFLCLLVEGGLIRFYNNDTFQLPTTGALGSWQDVIFLKLSSFSRKSHQERVVMLFLLNLRGIATQRSDRATLESFISKTESLSYSDQRLASNASNDCYRNALVQDFLCVCFTSAFHGSMLSPSTSQAWFNPIKVCKHLASALQLSLYTNDVLYSHYLSLLLVFVSSFHFAYYTHLVQPARATLMQL